MIYLFLWCGIGFMGWASLFYYDVSHKDPGPCTYNSILGSIALALLLGPITIFFGYCREREG